MLELRPENLLPGPVVAVNHAIKISHKIPVDMWASVDAPAALYGRHSLEHNKSIRFLSTEDCAILWRDLLGANGIRRVYVWPEKLMKDFLDERGLPPKMPTLVTTLAWTFKQGARHVRVFGSDMTGTGSPLAEDEPWNPETSEINSFRWAIERKLFAEAQKRYRADGRRLERWRMRTQVEILQ